MSRTIANIECIQPDFLPDLRADSELVLASDYAGEHKESRFQVFAYLLADRPGILSGWDEERKRIRQRFLRDSRRIAFKGLADRNKQKALGPFLASASLINGVLFCVAVDKSVELISSVRLASGEDIATWSTQPWKPKVLEKITDEDEIIPNEQYQQDACQIIGGMLQHYCPEKMGFRLGIAGKFEDDRRAEDLISIVDLAGGAFSESLDALGGPDHLPKSSNIVTPILKRMSTKSEVILPWLFESGRPLKKILCIVRASEPGKLLVSFPRPGMGTKLPGVNMLWLPPDKGWSQSAKSW